MARRNVVSYQHARSYTSNRLLSHSRHSWTPVYIIKPSSSSIHGVPLRSRTFLKLPRRSSPFSFHFVHFGVFSSRPSSIHFFLAFHTACSQRAFSLENNREKALPSRPLISLHAASKKHGSKGTPSRALFRDKSFS